MIKITSTDFSIENVIEDVKVKNSGAIACFVGVVRNRFVKAMRIECYKEFAEKELRKIEETALKKFDINKISIVHRVGKLNVGDNIVAIAVSSTSRMECFKCCKWLIDELKKTVPIWKEEIRAS